MSLNFLLIFFISVFLLLDLLAFIFQITNLVFLYPHDVLYTHWMSYFRKHVLVSENFGVQEIMLCAVYGIDYIISMSILWSLNTILSKRKAGFLEEKLIPGVEQEIRKMNCNSSLDWTAGKVTMRTEVVSEALRSQPGEAPMRQRWDKWSIKRDNNYHGWKHNIR